VKTLDGNGKEATLVRLLLGDVDAIKTFVYETNALPEIRGGSEILLELEGEVKQLIQQRYGANNLIYCGGGSFLAIVPDGDADALKREIERLYLKRTKTATITVVTSEPVDRANLERGISPHDGQTTRQLQGRGVAQDLIFSHFEAIVVERMKRKNFGEFVARLTGKLQEAKRRKEYTPFHETLSIHQRCQSCGKRAAESWDDVREEWLCGVCLKKRRKGREEKRDVLGRFRMWAQQKKGAEIVGKAPGDLDTMAAREGRIALLYADGNNMGDLLQRAESPELYRHISKALTVATEEALFEAIWSTFGQERLTDAGTPLPFEIIALGGDDVVVIVPASAGWTLAVSMLRKFECHPKIKSLLGEIRDEGREIHLNMSAGLAIADVKYPMRFLFDLTEGLLKEAKRLAREKQTGTLCHLWLRAPTVSEDAKELLDDLYMRNRDRTKRCLTARPYMVNQARELLHLARDLLAIPASQRRALAEATEIGVHVSLNYALYQTTSMGSEEKKQTLRDAFRKLGLLLDAGSLNANGFWFWRRKNGIWQTALLDVLELIELGAHKYPITEVEHD